MIPTMQLARSARRAHTALALIYSVYTIVVAYLVSPIWIPLGLIGLAVSLIELQRIKRLASLPAGQ